MTDARKDLSRRPLLSALLFVMAVVGSLALSACGGDDDGATETGTTDDAAGSTTSSTGTSSTDPGQTSGTEVTEPTTAEPGATGTATGTGGSATGPEVDVYFGVDGSSDCGEVRAYSRRLVDDFEVYRQTFQQLAAGPSASETADGATSMFSGATADVVKSAILTDGLLTVDFADLRPLIPNASASCGSEALLAQLNGTAFQFAEVERTRYLLDGSCQDFANWLQRECFDTDRSGRQVDVTTNERASGAGCTPPTADTLPPGRWFGFVVDADPEQLSFDLACWFDGAAAVAAAAEDGEESPPPNDYYIRNESDRIRVHVVESDTEVVWLPEPGDPATTTAVDYEVWVTERLTRAFQPGVWITTTDDSHVVKIEEQYVP